MITVTAALFVGGLSMRMGRDKALVEIDGEALWSRQFRLLRQLQPERICLSCRSKPSWCPSDVTVIEDEVPSRGPLSGLTAMFGQLQTTHLLAVAIDLPQMKSEVLTELWSAARPGVGVVPVMDGYFEPLCAIYPREAAPLARTALAADNLTLQKFVRSLECEGMIRLWPVPDAHRAAFLNVNSPADLEQL
jgi:molybdopterin-guanine dinucleotide biosynthesis protein A